MPKIKKQESNVFSLIDDYLEKLFSKRNLGIINMSLGEILKYELSFSLMRYCYNKAEEIEEWFEKLILLLIYSRVNGREIS